MKIHPFSVRSLSAVLAVFAVSVFLFAVGCGSDAPQTIVVTLEPWGLDFNTETDPQDPGRTFSYMYITERAFYLSVMRFELKDGVFILDATIAAPAAGGFSPYTIDIASGASSDVMFLTDITDGSPRLLAVNPSYSGDVVLESILLAETGGSPAEDFINLRGVASLHLGGDTYRVFLADDNKVWIIDYDVAAKTFSYGSPAYATITSGCGETLRGPTGLAVDTYSDPLTKRPALYIADSGQDALYRFSGIGGTVPAPFCDGVLQDWDQGSDYFEDPRGVAVLDGQAQLQDALIAVADTRKSQDNNDRVTMFTWDAASGTFLPASLPTNFAFFPNADPFDLAFDGSDNLWATYPAVSAIAGPTR